ELDNGVQVVVDTTGAFATVEDLPAASVLVTNRGVEVKTRHGVRRYAFDSLRSSVPLIITPKNAPTLLNQVLTVGIAVLAVGGAVAFLVLGFIAALLGAGYVLLLDALRHGPLRLKDAFAVAVYALTPFTVVLSVVLLAGLFSGSFLLVLWVGYCLLLAVAVIRIHRGVAVETR
ncbi:MAG: DUF1189 family protein, partial [Calditrichaeota bacterium]|nr:DUF1189 family protein [Calditrichota bacterium]